MAVDLLSEELSHFRKSFLRKAFHSHLPSYYTRELRDSALVIQRFFRGWISRKFISLIYLVADQDARLKDRQSRASNARRNAQHAMGKLGHLLRATDTTKSACAMLVQNHMRFRWGMRKQLEEADKKLEMTHKLQFFWRESRVGVREKRQRARVQQRDAVYMDALKQREKAVRRMERQARRLEREANDWLPGTPLSAASSAAYASTLASPRVLGFPVAAATNAAAAAMAAAEACLPELPAPPGHADLPAKLIQAAIEPLAAKLQRKDLLELRGYTKPPGAVRHVMECVCCLLGGPPDWEAAKLELCDASALLERLRGYGVLVPAPPRSTLEVAAWYLQDPAFDPDEVAKVAPAGQWLCAWCIEVIKACQHALVHTASFLTASELAKLKAHHQRSSSPPPSPRHLAPLASTASPVATRAATAASTAPRFSSTVPSAVPEWLPSEEPATPSTTTPMASTAELARLRPRPPPERPQSQTARPAPRPHYTAPYPHLPRTPASARASAPLAARPLLSLARDASKGGGKSGGTGDNEGSTEWLSATAKLAGLSKLSFDKGLVQTTATMEAADEAQAAALRSMLQSYTDAGGSAAEALALARRVAEPPPSKLPQKERCHRPQIFTLRRAAMMAEAPHASPRAVNSAVATLWLDGSLSSARAKQERAQLSQWRAKRNAFSRAGGLRRHLVQTLADDEKARSRAQSEARRVQERRLHLWHVEDAAAVTLQDQWRKRCTRIAERRKLAAMRAMVEVRHMQAFTSNSHYSQVLLQARRHRSHVQRSFDPVAKRVVDPYPKTVPPQRATAAQQSAAAESAKVSWTEGLDLKQVSGKVEAGLDSLLEQLKGRLAHLPTSE